MIPSSPKGLKSLLSALTASAQFSPTSTLFGAAAALRLFSSLLILKIPLRCRTSYNLNSNHSFQAGILPTMFTSPSKPSLRKMLTRTHYHIYRCHWRRVTGSAGPFVSKWFPFLSFFIKTVDTMRPVSPFRKRQCVTVVFPHLNHTNRYPFRS